MNKHLFISTIIRILSRCCVTIAVPKIYVIPASGVRECCSLITLSIIITLDLQNSEMIKNEVSKYFSPQEANNCYLEYTVASFFRFGDMNLGGFLKKIVICFLKLMLTHQPHWAASYCENKHQREKYLHQLPQQLKM